MESPGRIRAGAAALTAVLVLAGCGGTGLLPGRGHATHTSTAATTSGGQTRPAASAGEVAVVKGWSDDLRNGNVIGAAKFFHFPSVFANGATDVIEIHDLQDAEAANASLPCGATYISAFQQGKLVDALFKLGSRKGPGGGACGGSAGAGETARVAFLVQGGKIVHWLRAPSLPGDPGVPTTPAPQTGTGGNSGGTGTGPLTDTNPSVPAPTTPTEPSAPGNTGQV